MVLPGSPESSRIRVAERIFGWETCSSNVARSKGTVGIGRVGASFVVEESERRMKHKRSMETCPCERCRLDRRLGLARRITITWIPEAVDEERRVWRFVWCSCASFTRQNYLIIATLVSVVEFQIVQTAR